MGMSRGLRDGIERQACPRLAPVAFDLQPAESTTDAPADSRGGLSRAAIAFHQNRLGVSFGAVGLASGLLRLFAGVPSASFCAHDLAAPYDLSRLRAHVGHYSGLGGLWQIH